MANIFKIKDLRGVNGYQFMQVMYFLMRSAYYTPEITAEYMEMEAAQEKRPDIGKFFKWLGSLEGEHLDSVIAKIAMLGGDLPDNYWKIIFAQTECNGGPVIPEAIQTYDVKDLLYIMKEGLKKVLEIELPF